MKPASLLIMAIMLLSNSVIAGNMKTADHFGGEITLNHSISVDYAIEHYAEIKDKEVLVEGTTTKLCQQKGCWMVLKAKDTEIRVTFKDYAFFVPETLLNKKVIAQGILYEKEMNVSEARHFAQDAGLSTEEVQRINQPIKEYRFVATAVKVQP